MNLLSAASKKIIEDRARLRQIILFGFLCLALELIIGGGLITVKYVIQSDINNMKSAAQALELPSNPNRRFPISALTKETNSLAATASNQLDLDYPWLALLAGLDKITPAGITYNLVSVNVQTRQVEIGGHALTRENYLTLQDKLNVFPFLTNTSSPINNILKRTDIGFTLTSQLVLPAP